MTAFALLLVLIAAVLHATWNYCAKRAGGGLPFVWLVGSIICTAYVPVVLVYWIWQQPAVPSVALLWIAGSGVLQNAPEVLTAAQLNANFADLEERVGTLEADKVVLQTGTVGDSLQNGAWTLEETGDNLFDVPVTFSPAFPKAPKVLVVLKNIDAGVTATHLMIDASALNVSKTGFTIRFSDYSDSSIWAANATWIAYTD